MDSMWLMYLLFAGFSIPLWLTFFSILLSLSYACVLLWVYSNNRTGLHSSLTANKGCSTAGPDFPGISVIIPVRNEANHLPALLGDIARLRYSGEFEVLFVDDHSTDHSALIIADCPLKQVTCLPLPDGLEGKKAALDYAIRRCSYSLIVCTDGDVRLPSGWLAKIGDSFCSGQWDFCAFPVFVQQGSSPMAHFQWMEYLGMAGVTRAGIVSSTFFLANGANMAFTRAGYEMVDGFAGNEHLASGDDVFLVNKFATIPNLKVAHSVEPAVLTEPVKRISELFRQRMRWGGKNAQHTSFVFKMLIWLTGLANVFILITALALPWIEGYRRWMITGIIIKLIADYAYLRGLAKIFNQAWPGLYPFVVGWLVNTLYITFVAPWIFFIPSTTWKNRRVKTHC